MNNKKLLKSLIFGLTLGCSSLAQAGVVFLEDFETNTDGISAGGSYGNITQVASGNNGISSFDGGFHGIATQTDFSVYTTFDGYRDTFPGDYSAQVAVFLDTSWALGTGFQYTVASSGSDGNHQRDYVFSVTQDTSTGSLLVGGSNNANATPNGSGGYDYINNENLENRNNYSVDLSGWYIFEHMFRNVGGVLTVDLNLRDALGNLLFTETRSNPADTIPAEVGGNRYGWFTNIDVDGGLAIDNLALNVPSNEVPEPSSIALFGLAILGFLRLRKANL